MADDRDRYSAGADPSDDTTEIPASGFSYSRYGEEGGGTDSSYSYEQKQQESAQQYSYESAPQQDGGYSYGSSSAEGTSSSSSGGFYEYGTGSDYYNSDRSHEPYGGGSAKKRNRRKGGPGKIILALVLAVVFGVSAGAGVYGVSHYLSAKSSGTGDSSSSDAQGDSGKSSGSEKKSEGSAAAATGSAADADNGLQITEQTGAETDVSAVAEEVMPSLVSVYNSATVSTTDIFGQSRSEDEESTGTGIIVGKTDSEILVVTNNHVVSGADKLSVEFTDNETAEANIKGTDASNDLAVIAVSLKKVKSSTLEAIKIATLGDSDKLKIGQQAIAIGNALGYGQSVTVGYISAVNREIQDDDGITGTFIQTDAAINPGNSGGPLLDSNGNVIGINSSKIGATAVEGIGFAIPISKAEPIIEKLMNQTTKTRVDEDKQGTLGISGASVTDSAASAYNMPKGVYVASIIQGGGAASSDLQQGDIITEINGSTVTSMDELKSQLAYYEAGTEVTVTYRRQNSSGEYKEAETKVKLGTQASIQQSQEEESRSQGSEGSESEQQGGGSYNPFSFFGY